jgi:hypothetical protein
MDEELVSGIKWLWLPWTTEPVATEVIFPALNVDSLDVAHKINLELQIQIANTQNIKLVH